MMAVAVGVLMSMASDFSQYANFEAALAAPDRSHQVVGHLQKEKPVIYEPTKDPNSFSFHMKDENNKEMQVICKLPLPQDFHLSEQIVITGKMDGATFVAQDIQLKCPSKYQDEAIQNAKL